MARTKYVYDYPRPAVSVDVVILTRAEKPRVLLVRRKHDPFAGAWALPGGFVNMDETLEAAARRELFEETGVRTGKLQQLATFGDPGRDPRGRVISVVYLATVNPDAVRPEAADDAEAVGWFSLARPPRLAFDHAEILTLARRSAAVRKRKKKRDITRISTKGQIILPAELRQLDGIEPGQEFEIERIECGAYRLVRRQPRPNEGVVDWLLSCPEKGFYEPIESESTDTL